ncbi:MAG: TetR/AcrR family transcriptional regulator [Deltaproteobacteria bacterium]|nr:TetR/AcrR family transcriptional regulator [Deltaproteobacteria bacterium]MBW2051159.1 TetR/AcrR family transcriptional regulator [Deltaproteobacteria bacterium]MBW2140015.1 TetR/AcrR family transcriptional regulator [Deltaproteobacteria bacterium]MBW2324696.1 TetR/AcrR family transcriptional regulator [Deltaproteobacteria bacterium]
MVESETKQQRRLQIIEEARKLFARYGLKKTSMDDIAEAVSLVKTSLYYYFNNKEELFLAVIRYEGQMLINRLKQEIDRYESPQRKLRAYVISKMEYLKELVNLHRLTKAAAQELLPLIEEERQQFFAAEKKLVSDILEEGSRKNVFKVIDPELITMIIINCLRGLEPTILLYQERQLNKSDYNAMLDVLFYGVLKA